MDRHTSSDISSSKAVLLGALSTGVNGPTWFVVKIIFLLLGFCLAAMLALAFSSSDVVIAGHVILLVLISGVLFILLNRHVMWERFIKKCKQQSHCPAMSSQPATIRPQNFGCWSPCNSHRRPFLTISGIDDCARSGDGGGGWWQCHHLRLLYFQKISSSDGWHHMVQVAPPAGSKQYSV